MGGDLLYFIRRGWDPLMAVIAVDFVHAVFAIIVIAAAAAAYVAARRWKP